MENIQNITLDILNNKIFDYIYTKQNDVNREVHFYITEGGQRIENLDQYTIVFALRKPDGNLICDGSRDEITVENDYVKLLLTDQMTVLPGRLPYELTLKKDDVIVTTVTGKMLVEECIVHEGDIISSSGGSVIQDLLNLYENNIFQPTLATLRADGWAGTDTQTYRQTITAKYVVADQDNQFVVTHPKAEHMRAYVDAQIICVEQGNGYLTFECGEIPYQDIDIYVLTQGINSMTPSVVIEVSDTEPSQTENGIWLQPYPTESEQEEEVEP